MVGLPGQQPARGYRIGFLYSDSREGAAYAVAQLLEALAELGYVEGRNLMVEGRFGASEAQLPTDAAELVQAKVDLIVTGGTPAARAAKAATTSVPIVTISSDPVGAGLVESLARPGGNVTGFVNYVPDLTGKRLQLLREIVPGAVRVAFLTNPDNPTYAAQEKELDVAAGAQGLRLQRLEGREPAALGLAIKAASDGRAEALLVLSDSLVLIPERERIAQLAIQHRLPTMVSNRLEVEAGGLVSYSWNPADGIRIRAALIDKILKGAKPADLPMQGPTKFDLILNLKTAQAIGVTIPQSILAQATELIQ